MELMRKFELCFRFPGEENRYLIPDLLDKQQPQETADLEKEEGLRFQYHYLVLPEGLFPKFVVRTRELSTDQHRWRTGVVLRFEENQALVELCGRMVRMLEPSGGPEELAFFRVDDMTTSRPDIFWQRGYLGK